MPTPLTPEELLKPRYIVIADYPGSEQSNQIGKIYQSDECSARWLNEMSHYPHIFHKKSWWEHREESEMPRYLKLRKEKYDDYGPGISKTIFKVYKWVNASAQIDEENEYDTLSNYELDFELATKEEYETYKNKTL